MQCCKVYKFVLFWKAATKATMNFFYLVTSVKAFLHHLKSTRWCYILYHNNFKDLLSQKGMQFLFQTFLIEMFFGIAFDWCEEA